MCDCNVIFHFSLARSYIERPKGWQNWCRFNKRQILVFLVSIFLSDFDKGFMTITPWPQSFDYILYQTTTSHIPQSEKLISLSHHTQNEFDSIRNLDFMERAVLLCEIGVWLLVFTCTQKENCSLFTPKSGAHCHAWCDIFAHSLFG